jgi:hypothetical protein
VFGIGLSVDAGSETRRGEEGEHRTVRTVNGRAGFQLLDGCRGDAGLLRWWLVRKKMRGGKMTNFSDYLGVSGKYG